MFHRRISAVGRPSVVNWHFPREIAMPKLKTHKGASKRFKKTGTGKLVRHHAFARHILTSKKRSRKRKLRHDAVVDDANSDAVKSMLPY